MCRADAHTQIAAQEGCRQRARPVLRTRDLVGMTGVQVSGGKSARQRDRSARKRAAQLVRIPIESVGKEKYAAGIGLIGKLFRKLRAGLAPTLGIAGHPARFRLEITRQQTNHHRVGMQAISRQTYRTAEADHRCIAKQARYTTDNFARLILMRGDHKAEAR